MNFGSYNNGIQSANQNQKEISQEIIGSNKLYKEESKEIEKVEKRSEFDEYKNELVIEMGDFSFC